MGKKVEIIFFQRKQGKEKRRSVLLSNIFSGYHNAFG